MQFYGDHIEHDPSLLSPVRVIEVIPPRCYDVDPRPKDRVRMVQEIDESEWRDWCVRALVREIPEQVFVGVRVTAEYAYKAFAREWHTCVTYFDNNAWQYVRVGWYEYRLGWWWGREPTPPATVPEELDQRLRAYDPPRSEGLRLLDDEIRLRHWVYGKMEDWSDLPEDAAWLASIERGDLAWNPGL